MHESTLRNQVQDHILYGHSGRVELILQISIAKGQIFQKKSGERMPYPVGHRGVVKGKIIQSARRLFNLHGFDNVSIQQIMLGAGLTHGGFYIRTSAAKALSMRRSWDASSPIRSGRTSGRAWRWIWLRRRVVRAYLSRQHFEDVEN